MCQRLHGVLAALTLALALGVPGIVRAQQDEGQTLVIGESRLMMIRTGDRLNGRDWSVQDRIDRVHDVYAKYLGGTVGRITSAKIGERVHLYLNGDFVLAVTPADAQATGYKTAERLAPIWSGLLTRAFGESRGRPRP